MTLPLIQALAAPVARPARRALLWMATAQDMALSARALKAAGFDAFDTGSVGVLGVFVENPEGFARTLAAALTTDQQRAAKALLVDSLPLSIDDFARLETVESLIHHHSVRWLECLLDEGRYKSLLQPIVGAKDRAVHGHEFLFRGLTMDGVTVPPIDMFAAARAPGLAARLDRCARNCAVSTAARLNVAERLFINVLPGSVTLEHSPFTDTLDLIEGLGIDPGRVVFEIVETSRVDDIAALSAMIDFCRSAGYRIALDDFGSGYNNLNMLVGLKPDYIKLDKSLIQRVGADAHIWNLIANLVDAARHSTVLTVAEGVEDEQTAHLLGGLGVDFLQGYHLGRPADRPLGATARGSAG